MKCLDLLNCKDKNKWPKINKTNVKNEIKIVVQINGKTRDIIKIKKDLEEKEKFRFMLKSKKIYKNIKKY